MTQYSSIAIDGHTVKFHENLDWSTFLAQEFGLFIIFLWTSNSRKYLVQHYCHIWDCISQTFTKKISLNTCRALSCEFQYERRKRYISTGGNTVWNTEGNIWGLTRFDLHLGCPVLACRIVIRNTITSKYIKLFHTSSSSYLIFVNFSTLPHYWGP